MPLITPLLKNWHPPPPQDRPNQPRPGRSGSRSPQCSKCGALHVALPQPDPQDEHAIICYPCSATASLGPLVETPVLSFPSPAGE